jgi:hypothetical protein
VKLTEGQGAASAHGSEKAKALEKAKRKRASSSAAPKKRGRLIDAILHQSPLQSKGDSEDGGSESSNRPSAEEPPFATPKEATPLKAVHPNLDLEFSTAVESDDEVGDDEVNIVVDSPRRSLAPCEASASGKDDEKKNTASSSRRKGSGGEESSSTSDSSSFFVRNTDPEAAAAELGVNPTAVRLGGNIIKSLRFESWDRERELLSEAGGSFCFPLMEKDLMASGLTNMLESAQDLSLKAFVAARCAARQLATEESSKAAVADLEAKVAALEKEKEALQ